jgi:hypothetical protein
VSFDRQLMETIDIVDREETNHFARRRSMSP